jgi:uncharacterized protein YndB with AHSA1/START domain
MPTVSRVSDLTLTYETYIRTSPDALWDALTNPALTVLYDFGAAVDSTWQVGARIVYRANGGTGEVAVEGDLVEVRPRERLVHTWEEAWNADSAQDLPSRVTYQITPLGEVCKLTVVHDGFATTTKTYELVSGAWPMLLAGLKTVLETGEALPLPAGG